MKFKSQLFPIILTVFLDLLGLGIVILISAFGLRRQRILPGRSVKDPAPAL